MITVNRAEYLKTQLIPAVERELGDIPGVETLISKLRNEPWLKGRDCRLLIVDC